MKNARPHNKVETSAGSDSSHYNPGTLPRQTNTVTAGILSDLLESETPTGMNVVFGAHTTRLADVIHRLGKEHSWHIECRKIATGTNDGRVAWITVYWLPQATRVAAFDADARRWIETVKTARAKRSQQASHCKDAAARINAARRFKLADPRQAGLWEGQQ